MKLSGRVESHADHPDQSLQMHHFPGEVILLSVRWYLRYPLAYEHVAELLAERGVAVHPTRICRWVQTYAPELHKRWRRHLKTANKSLSHRRDVPLVRQVRQVFICGSNDLRKPQRQSSSLPRNAISVK